MNPGSPGSAPARLRERWRDTARDAILAAAEDALAGGAGRAGMARIAARAGVSVGTLYNHFRDRDALVAALLERRRAELFERVDRAIAVPRGGREARLAAAVTAVFEHGAEHHRFLAIVANGEVGTPAPRRTAAGSPTLDGLRARFTPLMPARARGEERAVLAELLTGMVRAMLLRVLATRAGFDPHAAAARVVRVFLDGARS